MNQQIASISIHDNHVILHLADRRELALSIEDIFFVQGWAHDNNMELLELLYQPKDKMFNAIQALREQEGREQML
ncbi:MAG TPA: hypothetical protein VKU38_03680 [Ktedonobacteraceae bacterium]|nr:hypothetical protein [Ktedonobacteraceae bacterium]